MPETKALAKSATGIHGFDEVTGGGLPAGRPTLVSGGPGCGKTLFAIEFLVRGATQFGEPGVFVAFEETADELAANVAALGFDLEGLKATRQLHIDHVHVERSEIEETGEYDLEGLFVRLGYAIDRVGAKRVVLDTMEALFGGFQNEAVLRAELRRLFRWLKDRGVTAIITAERGDNALTRYGLEEYVSDCVISLDHRVDNQMSTRRLRVVKYRGSAHGTNEYPFLIDDRGFAVMPITSAGLAHAVSNERVTTGIAGLDQMLGGKGYYRGSTVLLSGTAGTGKTITCAHMARAACDRGERVLYFSFEEAPSQLLRNTRSVGVDLGPWLKAGNLKFHATRPTHYGMEMHLARMLRDVEAFDPHVVIVDPISAFIGRSQVGDADAWATRLIDALKSRGITALLTNLTSMGSVDSLEATDIGISSLVDSWVLLRDLELNGERTRGVFVLKSRGMAHSNQIREFEITGDGVRLVDAYLGPEGVLTGSARVAQEARLRTADAERELELERLRRRSAHRRATIEAQMAALRAKLDADEAEVAALLTGERLRSAQAKTLEQEIARSRRVSDQEGHGAGESAFKAPSKVRSAGNGRRGRPTTGAR